MAEKSIHYFLRRTDRIDRLKADVLMVGEDGNPFFSEEITIRPPTDVDIPGYAHQRIKTWGIGLGLPVYFHPLGLASGILDSQTRQMYNPLEAELSQNSCQGCPVAIKSGQELLQELWGNTRTPCPF